MPAENLDKMFRPKSIAIVGASEEEGSVGRTIVENLVGGFKGEIFPVNPNRESVLGIPCLPSVKELKDKVDLAIVATPASRRPGPMARPWRGGSPRQGGSTACGSWAQTAWA
jgi:acetyltransferase